MSFSNRKYLTRKKKKEKDENERRWAERNAKLNEIENAIKDLDKIESVTEDAVLTWYRGPALVRIFSTFFEVFFFTIFRSFFKMF